MDKCCVKVNKEGPVWIVTYCSEKEKNLLTLEGMRQLLEILEDCEKDRSCKIMIVTGWGDYFCMGGYLGDYETFTSNEILQFADLLVKLHIRMAGLEKLTIAAVNGHTGGGGLSFLEAFDMAVAVEEATFCLPEIHNHLAPMISIMGVRNGLSRKQCMEMAVSGNKLTAKEALRLGLINKIVCGKEALGEAKQLAAGLLDINQEAFIMCKKYYGATQELSYEKQLEIGKQYLVTMLKFGYHAEGEQNS